MPPRRLVIIGGGAAGYFAAITAAETDPTARVILLERSAQVLAKVRISGGGRCNVTHACFDPREFVARYPRGGAELIGPFHRFQARDTVAWFAARGVELKTESDGRMFPVTDSSATIVGCLTRAAHRAGVQVRTRCEVLTARRVGTGFELELADNERLAADRLLLATGGCRVAAAARLATGFGHTLVPPVPSLFSFHLAAPWLTELAGTSVATVELSVAPTGLRECGPLLITHGGLSGPAVLRLSAWGARQLQAMNYQFPLVVNWLPQLGIEALMAEIQSQRQTHGAKLVKNRPLGHLPARLWEALVAAAGIDSTTRWSALTRSQLQQLKTQLTRTELPVTGQSLNKEEFVTCGGVKLSEVNFATMESRVCPRLHFAGELLDIDGLTGGFNFQAAWTTGWLAGKAMVAPDPRP